eukprot:NODE_164_length_14719_cov_1.036252.p2 type:complete len:683 gc:universal NODE_164_length_14719_cov_1.036252:6190-8238(+)
MGPFVIIVPNSTLDNWEREFIKWAPTMSVLMFSGDREDRESVKSYEAFGSNAGLRFHVLITTYSTTRLESAFLRKCGPYAALVVDESHNLKNERSLLYQCVGQLQVDYCLFLTGTPVQNKVRELFSLLNFLDPAEFEDVDELEKQYEALTSDLVLELLQRLKPYILRRTVKHIARELPPKKEIVIPCGMTALQKKLYKSVIENNMTLLSALDQNGKVSRTDIWMKLMRITMHPYAVDEDIEPRNLSKEEQLRLLIASSGKFLVLFQILDKVRQDKHKVIIFAQHKRSLDILQDILFFKSYPHFRMDGDTPRMQRQPMFDRFNSTEDIFCFLMTTRCGSEGINLTAASTVILLDMDFNPTVDKQAIGRCYRIGQSNSVLAIKLVTTDTVDQRRWDIANKKSTLNRLLVKPLDSETDLKTDDIDKMIQMGFKKLYQNEDDDKHLTLTDNQLKDYLDRSNAVIDDQVDEEDDAFADGDLSQPLHLSQPPVANGKDIIEVPKDEVEFWDELITTKMKEEEERRANEVFGRGMRKRQNFSLQDDVVDKVEDGDFVLQEEPEVESSEASDEELMVGDLVDENNKNIMKKNRYNPSSLDAVTTALHRSTEAPITRILRNIPKHRAVLEEKKLVRAQPANAKCWLCSGVYHHIVSCPYFRDLTLLRNRHSQLANLPHYRLLVEELMKYHI